MDWFVEACCRVGFKIKQEKRIPWNLKLLIGKLNLCFSTGYRERKLIVCSGPRPEYFSWPWCYFYEIVPVVWDCWPKYWPYLVRYIKQQNVRTIFLTSSIAADFLRKEIPGLDAVWLPEGIDTSLYLKGNALHLRTIDILELGRQYLPVHKAIISHSFKVKVVHKYQFGNDLLFETLNDLATGLSNSKIVICYPRSYTHPEQAGIVETMTHRYWECMLSGALIVGKAPSELVKFCGYNPVIELGDFPASELEEILGNIDRYQSLVDKNYEFASRNAEWSARMELIKAHIS